MTLVVLSRRSRTWASSFRSRSSRSPATCAGSRPAICSSSPAPAGRCDAAAASSAARCTVEEGYEAAREVGLQILATAKAALGDLDRVKRVVKVLGMVNCTPDFEQQPKVINGCSDLFVEVFGDAGRHTRSAVGFVALPGQIAGRDRMHHGSRVADASQQSASAVDSTRLLATAALDFEPSSCLR